MHNCKHFVIAAIWLRAARVITQRRIIWRAFTALLWMVAAQAVAQEPYRLQRAWLHQLGPDENFVGSISADREGGVYFAGGRGTSVYVGHYSAAGDLLPKADIGPRAQTGIDSIAVDPQGGMYVSGSSTGSLGGPVQGEQDGFVARYNSSLDLLWIRKIATPYFDSAYSLAVDGSDGVYLMRSTNDSEAYGFTSHLNHYDSQGNTLWERLVGVNDHYRVARVGNAVYVAGWSVTNTGVSNSIFRYDLDGNLMWISAIGDRNADAICTDPQGNIYVSGAGPNNELGYSQAFLSRYNAVGDLIWTREFGTAERNDESSGVAADGLGVYMVGRSQLNLADNHFNDNVFLTQFDHDGNLIATHELNDIAHTEGYPTVSADGHGAVFVAGITGGSLGAPNAGTWNGYVAKFEVVPEPSAFALLAVAIAGGLACIAVSWIRGRCAVWLFLTVFFFQVVYTQAAPVEWPIDAGGNGHFYELVVRDNGPVGWHLARAEAASMRWMETFGHLATITSPAETQFITAQFPHQADIYIGGFQDRGSPDFSEPAGGWRWVTGEPWEYTDWQIAEPNNYPEYGPEDYLQIFGTDLGSSNWRWNDNHDAVTSGQTNFRGFLVEFPVPVPEPSTILLCLLSTGCWIGFAARKSYRRRSAADP